jgi:hypothetical protein
LIVEAGRRRDRRPRDVCSVVTLAMHDGGEHRELGRADGVGRILDDWNKGGANHDRMDGAVGMPER